MVDQSRMDNNWKPAGQQAYEESIKRNPLNTFGEPRKEWKDLDGWVQRMWAQPEMDKRFKLMNLKLALQAIKSKRKE